MSESSSSSDSSSSSGSSGSDSGASYGGSYDSGASYGGGSHDASGSYGGAPYEQGAPYGGGYASGTVGGYATGDVHGSPYQPYPQPYPQHGAYVHPELQHTGEPYPHADPNPYGARYPQPAPYYGHAAYPYQPYTPVDDSQKNAAIGPLVTNITLTLLCCSPIAIAGIIVSALAMSRAGESPQSARSLVKWGWGLAIASVVLGVLAIVGYVAFLMTATYQPN